MPTYNYLKSTTIGRPASIALKTILQNTEDYPAIHSPRRRAGVAFDQIAMGGVARQQLPVQR